MAVSPNHFNKRTLLLVGIFSLLAVGGFATYTIASAQTTTITNSTPSGTTTGTTHNCPNMGTNYTGATTSSSRR